MSVGKLEEFLLRMLGGIVYLGIYQLLQRQQPHLQHPSIDEGLKHLNHSLEGMLRFVVTYELLPQRLQQMM